MTRIYIVAEAGVNHNGSLKLAEKLIDVASSAGADAVKFQTFKADRLVTKNARQAAYQIKNQRGSAATQWEMLKRLELGESAHHELFEYCRKKRIEFLSTPFDEESVDLLVRLGVMKLKIPSGEMTHAPLLLHAAASRLPIFLSTGMSTIQDIEKALGVIAFGYLASKKKPPKRSAFEAAYRSPKGKKILSKNVTLLHCTSEYPAPFKEINLRAMETLRRTFGLRIGLSDHSEGYAVPVAAAALGAQVIEKHFTLDRSLPGPDHKASLEPQELKRMILSIRQVEEALGNGKKVPAACEKKNARVIRRSLVARTRIGKGQRFSLENITAKRPATGISPLHYWDILGKTARRDYENDEALTL